MWWNLDGSTRAGVVSGMTRVHCCDQVSCSRGPNWALYQALGILGTWKIQLDCEATSWNPISSESKMQLKLSNCESSNLSLGTFSRDLFAQLFLVLGSHMGAPVVARCQTHRQALRFSVVQPFYCSTHQVRGCSINLCLGLPDSATSIQIWSNKIPTCSLAAHVCRPCSSLASRGYDFSEWEHGDLGNQRICATISWITTEAQQRTQQGWPIAIASRSGLWHWTYLDMIWTSYVGTSWTCLWYLLVSPSSMGMVSLCSCLDEFRCNVCTSWHVSSQNFLWRLL